ncbi:DNA primase [Hydrogenimonas cancrithermarum]|uniref:DNA primase n=1 Tax=Hydrogenimonas cancrithermarum TaxID=2993563 RepID=A0ABN6WVC6_9BACT|nr:DNA primase [Hydrogenimonas cancrithermarum]BDY13070.1 DNA primase [Hydrogenimonas cancrithermarum]
MIDNNSIEQLKQTIDIVDVVGNYVELKKNGSNFKGLCPFHDEKTPSFIVSPTKQFYKCFGCGAGGDAIKFLMEYEKLNYPEAIEKLAQMYNFTLRYTEGREGGGEEKRILETVGQWYRANLEHHEGAKNYLKARGVSLASIEKFSLGYAPSSEETLHFLQKAMIPMQKAEEVGILGHDRGRYYARLIDRIIFPIHSPSGMPVGFGGRTMGSHPAKYINSPQTKLFNKSRLLYGYHLAKEQIYRKKRLIVVEGYMDVIMLHQAGFGTAVATLGTALTNDHLPLLKKGEPEVIVAYDGDNAGINAAMKAALLLSSHNFEGGVVLFGNGMDPADMVNAGNADAIEALFSKPIPYAQFVIDQIVSQHNIHTPKGKEDAFHTVKNYLATLSPFVQEKYLPYAALRLGVNVAMLAPKTEKPVYRQYSHDRRGTQQPSQPQPFLTLTDVAEESIIKTLLKIPTLTDMVLDTMDSSMFGVHREAFEALLQGGEHEDLLRIELDDTIVTYSEEELKKQLVYFLQRYYKKALDNIKKDDRLPFEKKIFYIRKYQDYINHLKRGELVPYESNRTF